MLVGILGHLLLLAIAVGAAANTLGIEPGRPAPGFELSALDGRRYRLGDIQDRKSLLLVFFDPESRASQVTLRELAARVATDGGWEIEVWAVASGTEDQARTLAHSQSFPFPILLDPAGRIAAAYGAGPILPLTFAVDRNLKVAARFVGGGPSVIRELERWIADHSAQPSPPQGGTFADYRARGVQAFNAKRYRDAERLLRKALAIRADKGAYVYLVYTLRALGDKPALERTLRTAITRFPREPRFYKIYARWLIENERLADAAHTVESGLRIAPADVELAGLKDYLDKTLFPSAAGQDRATRQR